MNSNSNGNTELNLSQYQDFVENVTSSPSRYSYEFKDRYDDLDNNILDINIPSLLTAAFGLSSEAGEFTEIVKKILFQGKPLDADNVFHMKRELGDIAFYLAVACSALDVPVSEIIQMNVEKLSARYPDGFSVEKSENRKVGDI